MALPMAMSGVRNRVLLHTMENLDKILNENFGENKGEKDANLTGTVTSLPRDAQLWYKYTHMEETHNNIANCYIVLFYI